MRIGDAFGELMRAALAEETAGPTPGVIGGTLPRAVIEIIERDDGFLGAAPAARYFCGPDRWSPLDLRMLDLIDGRTLDVGAGAGRLALALQGRGTDVTALDISPGAVAVARARGVAKAVCSTVDEHAAAGPDRYDCFALFGNNLGLLESRDRAPRFLAALAAMARPGARIVAQGTDPYGTDNPVHLAYHEANRAAGRLAGQLRLRPRHQDLAGEWFSYLLCSPAELAELIRGSGWAIDSLHAAGSTYLAVLGQSGVPGR
jgi:SAM-dependent methyltransferase